MKKLVFAFAAIVAVSFASCGGNTAATEVAADSTHVDTTAVDSEAVVDSSAVVDTLAAAAE